MLEHLGIDDLGIIVGAELEFGPGLNVITGETGAGKTMVVTALGLLLGERADSGLVRDGAARSVVQGRLDVSACDAVAERAAEAGGELDDGSLIVTRTVSVEGRSKATAGGVGVPAGTLGGLTRDLVAVHGQSDQHHLLSRTRQRQSLDRFAGPDLAAVLATYQQTFTRLSEVSEELQEVTTRSRERAQEADVLRFGIKEIDDADPQPGEEESLAEEEDRLAHAESLRRAAEEARLVLSGEDGAAEEINALTFLARARKALEAERGHDQQLAQLSDRLAEASYTLTDTAADIASYAESVETDPARLEAVSERRGLLGRLVKKYGDTVADVVTWADGARQRLATLDRDDTRTAELRSQRDELQTQLDDLGEQLTTLRRSAATGLAQRVTAEIGELAMPNQEFSIRIDPLAAPGADGRDEVTFCLAAGEHAEPRPLQRVASGGELSRVMLALEVSLADSKGVPTYVFDEVDAGVGGRAAIEVGRRLARLARIAQVVVVTHLPQVAAFADRHYVVVKDDQGTVDATGARAVDQRDRLHELSRMLAGMAESESALAHAEELLELAAAERS